MPLSSSRHHRNSLLRFLRLLRPMLSHLFQRQVYKHVYDLRIELYAGIFNEDRNCRIVSHPEPV